MVKKISVVPPRKKGRSITDEKVKARLEEQHEKQMEAIRQCRVEHEKNVELEEDFRHLQLLRYEPVDYAPLLMEIPWQEPPSSSYEFLMEQAVLLVEEQYRRKWAYYGAGFIASFTLFLLMPSSVALGVFLLIGLLLVYLFSHMLRQKQKDLILAQEDAQREINRLLEIERLARAEERKKYEFNEQLRISELQKIIEGEMQTLKRVLKEKLEGMILPVNVQLDLTMDDRIVDVAVQLPDLEIIPKQRSRLTPSGYIEYDEKQEREIFKQYFDMIVGLLIHVSVQIFMVAPTINTVCTRGMADTGYTFMYLRLTREMLVKADGEHVIPYLMKNADIGYDADPNFHLAPIKPPAEPEEWEQDQELHKITLKILKHGVS